MNHQSIESIAKNQFQYFNNPEGPIIFSLDCNYRYVFFNTSHYNTIKEIWGIEIEIGRNMLEIIGKASDRSKAKRNFDRAINGETFKLIEEYGDEELGRYFYEDQYSPFYDSLGNVAGLTVYVRDVSQQENSLIDKRRQDSAIQASKVGIWDRDLSTGKVFFSKEWKNNLGYQDHEIVHDRNEFLSRIHPDDVDYVEALFLHVVDTKQKSFELEFRLMHRDGTFRWMYSSGAIEYDKDEKAKRLFGTQIDITQRKQLTIELAEKERLVNESQKIANIGHYFYSITEDIWSNSPQLDKIFGIDDTYNRDFEGWMNLIVSDQREAVKKYFDEEVLGNRQSFDKKYHIVSLETGEIKYLHGLGRLVIDDERNMMSLVGTIQDITDQHEKEKHLMMLSKFAEHSEGGLILTDAKGITKWVHHSFEELTGYAADEVIGRKPGHLLQGFQTDQSDVNEIRMGIKSKKPFSQEILNYHKNGKTYWQELKITPLLDEDGKVVEFLGVQTDISERKKAELALQKSEKRYRYLAENTSDAVILFGANLSFDYVSPGAENILDYEREEYRGLNPLSLVHPDDLFIVEYALEELLNDKEKVEREFRILKKSKEQVWINMRVKATRNPDGTIKNYLATCNNITGRKRTEIELKETLYELQQSLYDRDVLYRELHHRIKNNLQTVSSLLHIKSRAIKDERFRLFAKDINSKLLSVASIHESLLAHEAEDKLYIRKYLIDIALDLINTYSFENLEVELLANIRNYKLDADIALTLGLIVHEVVSNSMKYAFPMDYREGRLMLNLMKSQDEFTLTIGDNGQGFDIDQRLKKAYAVGLHLIESLVKQINGTYEVEVEQGVKYIIKF